MLKLPQITLCTFGAEKYKESQQNMLKHCHQGILFGDIKNIIVPTNTIDEWNRAVVFDLGDHIDTEFALLVHPDGGVANPDAWDDKWLEYDFIGAPWPIPEDDFSYVDIGGVRQRVGNSVALRSKKLMQLPKKENFEWKAFHGFFNEDGYIAVNMRHKFEEHGCKFAPFEEAVKFGMEHPLPEHEGVRSFTYHKNYGTNAEYPNFEI